MSNGKQTDLIIFESKDGLVRVDVRTDYDTIWLTKPQLAALFERDRTVISRHISNIYQEGELDVEATCANFAQVQFEGGREVVRDVEYFNLDVIISVGYRVKSQRGVEFRQWATRILRDYLVEGYALNPRRMEQSPGALLDLFKMQVQLWERQELVNTDLKKDIEAIGKKIHALEAKVKSVDDHYFTIAGYCNLHNIPCPLDKAKEWGKQAVKLSREQGFPTGTAHDERFGQVRTYHVDVLKLVVKK